MIKEAIILAGGLGTRLRSVISELPKCMAPVAGKPFLYYVIAHLQKQGVDKFIFSIGDEYIRECLGVDFIRGIPVTEVEDRISCYGSNAKEDIPPKCIFLLKLLFMP